MAEEALPKVLFFASRESLRDWFERHHARASELWVGYYKRGSGRTAVTYLEAVEEALCFGWIDGRLRSLDGDSYAHRYTPRGPKSRWSATNVARARALERAGRMRPAGRAAFHRGVDRAFRADGDVTSTRSSRSRPTRASVPAGRRRRARRRSSRLPSRGAALR